MSKLPLLPLLLLSLSSPVSAGPGPGNGGDWTWMGKPKKAPVITAFTATPSTVVAYGSSTLAWTVTGYPAPTLSIDQSVGTVTGSSTSVSLAAASVTYTLTATNAKGSTTATATITVTGPYLISDDGNAFCHTWWDGSAIQRVGCGGGWVMNGTVPQVAASGSTPPGAGTFSDANYYAGTGADPMDTTGDWTGVIVASCSALDAAAADRIPFSDATATTLGWFVRGCASATPWDRLAIYNAGAAVQATYTATTAVTTAPNVLCFGKGSSNAGLKENLAAAKTAVWPTYTAATSQAPLIGRVPSSGHAHAGVIYEVYFTSTPWSDALCTTIANQVKTRAAISAW